MKITIIFCLQLMSLKYNITEKVKVKEQKKIHYANTNQKKGSVAIFMSN